ncbi:MAG TPA: phosphoenolpyruvate--protein phosphotransferase [Thermoanaerobaculaceae bacterium]|nr:phosphoenolpyruvate--protein phosphotransferase [Thermoanaerobaculaceae bacterium]
MPCELEFRFPLRHGLHARPAAALCAAASPFAAEIVLANRRSGRQGNAKSALALVATLTRPGDGCTLRIAGEDEAAALAALRRFVSAELPLCDEEPAAPARDAGEARPLPRALRREGVVVHRGVAACGGIGRAPALVAARPVAADLAARPAGSPAEETARFERACAEVGAELRRRRDASANATERAILAAHLAILTDPELRAGVARALGERGGPAGQAVLDTAERFAAALTEAGSALLAERALDVRDVAVQVVRALDPDLPPPAALALERDAVVAAEELSPAQFLALDSARLKGLVLARGGVTSHTVVLARARGVPCVTGAGDAVRALRAGQDVIVDGERGLVVADPAPEVVRFYAAQAAALGAERARLAAAAARPAATAEGRRVEVGANVASLAEARAALAAGAEGIGLFRTEMLFMERAEAPSEEEQAAVYAEAARLAGGRPVVIRTLDAGGDKPIPYLALPAERNPFLGLRAVRIYDAYPDLAAAQVRAIVRASAAGNVRIMFPMVASLEELRALRALVAAQMRALAEAGVPFDPALEVGVMVEVPAVAFAIDEVAREADFLSIGSNDLLQYLLAVDRDNPRVAHLYDPFQPAFVRVLAAICRGARAHGRRVGLCGELGGDARAVPLLVGLGLDEVSVGAARIGAVKAAIAGCSATECEELARAAAAAATAAEVRTQLDAFAGRAAGGALLAADLVRLGSRSATREEAIRELVDLLRAGGRVADPDEVEDAVWRREDAGTTGVGFGIAIPHCRSEAVRASSIAVASYPDGVAWASLDGAPVGMAILIAVSARAGDDAHLRMIAALSRRLMDDGFRARLLAAGDAAEVVALVAGAVETREAAR